MPVFVFPGQGAQFPGMGMDLYEADSDGTMGVRALFSLASDILGKDIASLLTADEETLKRTDVSQVAITVASLAAVRALAAKGIKPAACAGFSLGEYPALATAGVISEADAIKLTIERGRIMQEAATALQEAARAASADPEANVAPGMAAVIGLPAEKVDAVIAALVSSGQVAEGTLFAANYNSPLQTVVSGTASALDRAEPAFKEAGARRALRLKVAGPFHSPLMAGAGAAFSRVLEPVSFASPAIALFSNVTGARITSGSEAKSCAVEHISRPVRWTEEEAAIAALMGDLGIADLVEVGPGRVLTGLWGDSKLPGACKPYADVLSGAVE